jgi:TATA-box binding protein (TBP) (component of TFIID and TFIIIB)
MQHPRKGSFSSSKVLEFKSGTKLFRVFSSGKIHATGCPSILYFVQYAHAIALIVGKVCSKKVVLETASIEMINAGTAAITRDGHALSINPGELFRSAARAGLEVIFEPEKHAGVKFVYRDCGIPVARAFLYITGNVTILGARKPRYIADIFETVVQVVATSGDAVQILTKIRTTTSKRQLRLTEGYPDTNFEICMT